MIDYNDKKYQNDKGRGFGKGFNTAMYGNLNHFNRWGTQMWSDLTGKSARDAQEAAARAAETARRESIVKEYGARQQADNMAYASAMNGPQSTGQSNTGSANSNAPGLVGQGGAPGTIGSNISSSGTF